MNWIQAISTLTNQAQGYVLVTVLDTKGSSPRDTGTKMVVSADESFDTIGGGALEYQSIKMAREFLQENITAQHKKTFNLGKDLKQCCGGVVRVFFEVFPSSNFNIVIFGAGHIGKSLIKILEDIDCQVKWFDSRQELFPERSDKDSPSPNIQKKIMTQPELAVESCQTNSYFLVMTHDHALDQQLCESIISRGDSLYCGLIGSTTKGLKFRQRLLKKNYKQQEIDILTCPAGLSSLKSKKPMEIAVSIILELLKLRDKHTLYT